MPHGGRTTPRSASVQSAGAWPLPDVAHRFVRLGRYWQQDGFGSVLKERRPVLGLAFLDPVAVDLEGARVDELADGFDGVRVALDHRLGDGFGAAVVAVDAHGGQNGHANDLREESRWVLRLAWTSKKISLMFMLCSSVLSAAGACQWDRTLTLNRLYGLNSRTSSTTYWEKKEWLRTSLAVNRCFGSTTSIREICGQQTRRVWFIRSSQFFTSIRCLAEGGWPSLSRCLSGPPTLETRSRTSLPRSCAASASVSGARREESPQAACTWWPPNSSCRGMKHISGWFGFFLF